MTGICFAMLTSTFATDQPAQVLCTVCGDVYCEVCFAAQHRKGSRKTHKTRPLAKQPTANGHGTSPSAGDVGSDPVRGVFLSQMELMSISSNR